MAPNTEAAREPASARSASTLVMLICLVVIIADGYDLVVYGVTVPSILAYEDWGVTPSEAGTIGSLALLGMLIGTLVVGVLTDIVGRRKIMLWSVTWFSVVMGLTALAPNAETFALLRFLGGLGLGGVVPTAIALTVEYSPKNRHQLYNALMYSGYFMGAMLSAVLGIALLPDFDFRIMYAIGVAFLFIILPVAWRYLPESAAYLLARGRHDEAQALADKYGLTLEEAPDAINDAATQLPRDGEHRPAFLDRLTGVRVLFSRRYILPTLLFAAMSFCGLLIVYAMNTWLPNIMKTAGYSVGSSLTFLLVLNTGGIVGTIALARVADQIGVKVVTIGAFLAATASILLLSVNLPAALLFMLVAIAGMGTGTQILVNGFVATFYPDSSRATALGWSLGVGRVGAILGPTLGGAVAGSSLSYHWNFYLFAAFTLLGALFTSLVPLSRASRVIVGAPKASVA
jgi:MFS transporter, AAHS family, benzoate transport protein